MKIYTHTQTTISDTKTPIALYLALRDLYPDPLLLESSDYNSRSGHFSYICLRPLATVSLHNSVLRKKVRSEIKEEHIQPEANVLIPKLIDFKGQFQFQDLDLPFCYAGLFGYSGYGIINYAEDIKLSNKKTFDIPDLYYNLYGIILVFEHHNNSLHIVSHDVSDEGSKQQLQTIYDQVQFSTYRMYEFAAIGETISSMTDASYMALVTKAKVHCRYGDVFQLVLSKRFAQPFTGDEFNVYRALKNINPSPYLFYFDLGAFKLFGSSPEAQLMIKNGEAEIHPIAGTYRRTQHVQADLEKVKELLNDPKENAEHMMLVDLARNDLSKYCKHVNIALLKQAQLYSHVIHLVSKVKGDVGISHDPFEVLLGTFPTGTLSGAPKYRAMELIDEYETEAREFYGGCIGFIGQDNSLNHAIMIRTFLSKSNVLYYQAGAGIVISSDEEKELNEVKNKVSALQKAVKLAEKFNNIAEADKTPMQQSALVS
jgi:anthranilate synthase component 1